MRTVRRTRSGSLLLAVVLFASCADGPAGPLSGEADGLSFSYAGSASGSYLSSGAAQLGGGGLPVLGDWAVARPDSLGGLLIAGFQRSGESSGKLFILQFPVGEAGTYTCAEHGQDGGCHGRIFLGVDPEEPATGEVFSVTGGSATLDEVSAQRVRGSFTLDLVNGAGAGLSIDDGQIDVDYHDDVSLANGIACLARNLLEATNEPCD